MNEGVKASSAPNKEWFDVFVVTKTALPVPKQRKSEPKASASFNPIPPNLFRPSDS